MLKQVENTLKNLSDMPEPKKKSELAEIMSMTQSWLNINSLKDFLPEDQYTAVEVKLQEIAQKTYAIREGWTEEEIASIQQEFIETEPFFIVKNEDNTFGLRRLDFDDMLQNRNFQELDLSRIDSKKFTEAALKAFKEHREYGTFHSTKFLSDEEIKEVLDLSINALSNPEHTKEDVTR